MAAMLEMNMIHRMNLFMTMGVRQIVYSQKGTFHEEISSGIGTNQAGSPRSSALDSQLAPKDCRL
jgi:hypothetical protein